ncbi:MAG: phosphoenolpyruvate carboxylase [Pyrinomonadaceae bacterium]|nr:phosphoenolpyruvate carboxylase [Pyrinomonadaceae bacterium]
MDHIQIDALDTFENTIGINFGLYNSLFLSLPFHGIEKTGILLSLFNQACEEGFEQGDSPSGIVDSFFSNNTSHESEQERLNMLFRFVQYCERQVVLFDALEDASFDKLHNMNGPGTLSHLENAVLRREKGAELAEKIRKFGVRLVLTAHPTQFYPGAVLGIINDLSDAIERKDVNEIKTLLQQLGRTPFLKKEKPTPVDEALSLIWYLENVFYHAIGRIISKIQKTFPGEDIETNKLVKMGFWSGGDRDGNPFVKVDTTIRVSKALRAAILRSYYQDIKKIKRRITFSGVEDLLADIENRLYKEAFQETGKPGLTKGEILNSLHEIRDLVRDKHNGLFVWLVEDLIYKVGLFGLHFASLDIRQDSSVHENIYGQVSAESGILPADFESLSEEEKIDALLDINETIDPESFQDELTKDTFKNIKAVKEIQKANGELGCHRYIISHSQTALDVIEVIGLFLLGGWKKEELSVDIIPLFETVEDLQNSAKVMRRLYENADYRAHLKRRGDAQTIMLGFSDGTKDGGYLMANWGIYKAKDRLTEVSREFGIDVIFFDGRGGPPARGGGKTHKFFSSMGENISDRALELTIQGQTVSSNFGTIDAAQYNIEQLLSAGIYNSILEKKEKTFSSDEEVLMGELAGKSYETYCELKNDPAFLDYLENVSPLKFYARTNIGSRPARRGGASSKLTLDSLRAIPFVGAWSQMKQNVPGFYGVGSALKEMESRGRLDQVTQLYKNNPFFRALIDNSEMAMQKTFFPLTQHLKDDKTFGKIWQKIKDEYDIAHKYLAMITEKPTFMTDAPVSQKSVKMREGIVLPLTTIQQHALTKIRTGDTELKEEYEKLIVRCSFGIINAGRNSA